jgi:bifunctional enzyme CysN/CysC
VAPGLVEGRVGLLRVATAGSVDDGKSTLIGRLLYDTKSILQDQLEAVERDSFRRGHDAVNLALLTDGLRAEREQGITIDVAYRYFATPRRTFVLIDAPGHEQYTRNMVTGASTADVAVVLVDARKGVMVQTRRHSSIAALLQVPHVVLAVNKMDLVGWSEETFDAVAVEFAEMADQLGIVGFRVIPVSALHGDNVVAPSQSMPWYIGPTLLEHLETVEAAEAHNLEDIRFPVQFVILSSAGGHHDERAYAGRIAAGVVRPGTEALVLPAGLRTRIAEVFTLEGPLAEAFAPASVSLRLADDLDVGRGDMIVGLADRHEPLVTQDITATVCWLSERPLRVGATYSLKHTTRSARAIVRGVDNRLDVNTFDRHPADGLSLNEIGEVTLKTTVPLVVDPYTRNRVTGSFILVDEATHATAGAGMVLG